MRYAGKSAIIVAVAALALTAAPGASAKFAPTAAFSVSGTHGYTVRFEAQGKGGQVLYGHGRLGRTLRRGQKAAGVGGPQASGSVVLFKRDTAALYLPLVGGASFTHHEMSAKLGGRGRFDVRFHETARKEFHIRHCSGHIERRVGVFTGTIRFKGEHRYTVVSDETAHGKLTIPRHLKCPSGGGGGGGATGVTLAAERSTKRSFTDVSAFAPGSYSERAPGFVEADRLSGGSRLLILRSVFDRLPSAAFTYAQDLSSATLDAPPGSSLAGSADFAKPHALTGDLTADFPGAVGVQLTGPKFRAKLRSN